MAAPLKAARAGSPLWPGITTGHDACCSCTWAHYGGVYQVKVRNALCVRHPRHLTAVTR